MRTARWSAMVVVAAISVVGFRAAAQSPPPAAESPAAPAIVTPVQQADGEAPSSRREKSPPRRSSREEAHLPSPDWQPGQAVPEGYHPVLASRRGVLGLGIATLAVSYGASTALGLLSIVALVGTGDGETSPAGGRQNPTPPFLYLFTPVVGPFIAARADGCGAICIVDGAVQTAGLGLIIFGLVAREPVLVRNRLALSVVPARMGPTGEGVELFGRF